MKATKITQPMYVGNLLGPKIDNYVKKLNNPGITYESMCVYFTNVVQFGGDHSEFWVIFDEGKPLAFANWHVRALPYMGVTYLDNIFSWTKNQEPVDLLIDEIINFMTNRRTPILHCDVLNEIVGRRLELACEKLKQKFQKTEARHYIIYKQMVEQKNENNNQKHN